MDAWMSFGQIGLDFQHTFISHFACDALDIFAIKPYYIMAMTVDIQCNIKEMHTFARPIYFNF